MEKSPNFLRIILLLIEMWHLRQTRQADLLHLPKVRTEAAKKSFYYSGCQIYNSYQNNM